MCVNRENVTVNRQDVVNELKPIFTTKELVFLKSLIITWSIAAHSAQGLAV